MIYAKVETSEKKAEIEAALKDAKNISWYRRLKVIQLSSQGKSVAELAQLFDVCSSVVRHYIHLYNEGGLEKLAPALIPGRPRLLSQFDGEWLGLQWKSPSQYEKLQTQGRRWTLQLLVSYVDLYYDIETTTVTVSAALKRNGLGSLQKQASGHFPRPRLHCETPKGRGTEKKSLSRRADE